MPALRPRWWTDPGAAAVALAAALAVLVAWPRLQVPMNWDATHVYLPMARQLLSEGLAFFSDPASVRMAPFTYVYPAIFAGEAGSVRRANVMLFAVIVILVAAAAWTAHS